MQSTDRAVTMSDIASGLQFEFDPAFAVLALAVYGYTGVNSAEISAYTYWCVERGIPQEWVSRVRVTIMSAAHKDGCRCFILMSA